MEALGKFKVRLLAEKIDSEANLDACIALGFGLFQGYYLRRTETLHGRTVKAGHPSALTLASECRRANSDLARIDLGRRRSQPASAPAG